MRYLSVCSGIEAVSVAWGPLGWKPAMFAEIDPFCCWLLHSRYRASRPIHMPSPQDAATRKEAKHRAAAIRNIVSDGHAGHALDRRAHRGGRHDPPRWVRLREHVASRRAQTRTTQPRTSQLRRAASLLPALSAPALEPCNSPSTPSRIDRFFAWQGAEDDGERTAWFTHCLLLQPEEWRASTGSFTAVRLHRHPERHAALHASVSVQCHLSSYFPCSPSVTRFGADPAPCGTRRSASHFVRPSGLGFQTKIYRATGARLRPRVRARFFFGASAESTPSALGAGTLASLRARVSRGQSGQIQTRRNTMAL
jgi:hypothetical protein